jgi:hypothetical protein
MNGIQKLTHSNWTELFSPKKPKLEMERYQRDPRINETFKIFKRVFTVEGDVLYMVKMWEIN